MFRSFFLDSRWMLWSLLGTGLIMGATWYLVYIDVQINDWFGVVYDFIQEAITNPGSVTLGEFLLINMTYVQLSVLYIVVAVVLEFFTKHYIFRWRTAMNNYYMSHWADLRHIEGAAQRVQEDTMRFASIVESLGITFLRSMMTLIAFMPILWTLSKSVPELPWIGPVDHALVYVAIASALFGTVLLAVVGIKLPGLEFNNQKVEAAYRKELVYGEDHEDRAAPPTVRELFAGVRKNYFKLYFHYMYFDVVRYIYLRFSVMLPYVAMGPSIIAGLVSFGVLQQTVRAFDRVEASFQILVHSWPRIIELMSIYKRLVAFEKEIKLHPYPNTGENLGAG